MVLMKYCSSRAGQLSLWQFITAFEALRNTLQPFPLSVGGRIQTQDYLELSGQLMTLEGRPIQLWLQAETFLNTERRVT